MGKTSKLPEKQSDDGDVVFLDQFHEGLVGPITMMVCRKWDVFSVNGPYVSTDYIISDKNSLTLYLFPFNIV